MKFCRFLRPSRAAERDTVPAFGLLERDRVREIGGVPWGDWVQRDALWDLKKIQLLAPCEPSKIVCVGRN